MVSVNSSFGTDQTGIKMSCPVTSHSAYVATETELVGAKIDGLLPPKEDFSYPLWG